MDVIPKPQSKGEKSSSASDAEKLEQAIKKAKYERARKAVNDSFDRSIGSLRKRKQKKNASMNQSFAIKQAATLQRKNKEIISALAKTKQYASQLEKVNYYFKEQQLALAMKVASLERKLKVLRDDYHSLKVRSNLKDKILATFREQFQNSLKAIESVNIEDDKSSSVTSQLENLQRQPIRVARDAASSRDSEASAFGKPTVDFECETKSPDHSKGGTDVPQSPPMPVLSEENSQEFSDSEQVDEDEQNSFCDISKDVLNDASAKLDVSDCTESDSSSDHSKNDSGEDLESGDQENDEDFAENMTNHDTVSMELTDGYITEDEKPDDRQDVFNVMQPEKSPNIAQEMNKESMNHTGPLEKTIITKKQAQRTLNDSGKQTSRKMKKPCTDVMNTTSSYDFLSCSSDSFILDNEKRVKLNCTKSLSPLKSKNIAQQRLSQPAISVNNENSPPARRTGRRRAAGPVSYAEPSLNSKLRRGDQIADGSLVTSFSPQKKTKRKMKKKKQDAAKPRCHS